MLRRPTRLLALLLCLAAVPAGAAPPPDDRFLEGYAAAVLALRFGLKDFKPSVRNGTLLLDPARLQGRDPTAIAAALRSVDGLRVVLDSGEQALAAAPVSAPKRTAPPPPEKPAESTGAAKDPRAVGWLPPAKAFAPLIADPRWPRFSASVQFYQDDPILDTVGSANVGASIPAYGWEAAGAVWQLGLQAGVFSIFDLNAPSNDLVNADYFIALPLTARHGDWSGQLRLFHQSSHLGDEFLLRNPVNRINLSYEGIDFLVSRDFDDILRLYGGGGGLFNTDPRNLKPWFVHGGFQLTSPYPLFTELLYPLAALDIQADEQESWDVNYSLRAGVEFRSQWLAERRLQFLFEYFNGHSPNGQFFQRNVEYFGTGLHFFF
jgi:hypothetical protein